MGRLGLKLAVFSVAQIAAVTLYWYVTVLNLEWGIVQQFYGHIGPAIFLVAMGAVTLFLRHDLYRLNTYEAWLAVVAGAIYVIADTLVMHPPFGVFDGAGNAEQEHVALMSLVFVLGVSGLVALRKQGKSIPTSAHFVIGIVMVVLVFSNHPQHTVAGTVGHYGTVIVLGMAGLFRILGKMTEYAISMIVTGFLFFSSQMGLAMYVDAAGHSPTAWVVLWATLGFVSATCYMTMAPGSGADQD